MAYQSKAIRAFAALGDPTRRAIFVSLSKRPSAVGELATLFPVTRSAVSQHLRVLKEAELVTETAAGTRRIYKLDPRGIGAMREWLDGLWGNSLDAFKNYIDQRFEEEKKK